MMIPFPSRSNPDPVPVRGHTLLCLQGFKGEGYDPMFTAHMASIHALLLSRPETAIRVITSADTFCHFCPNLDIHKNCILHGEGSEKKILEQDREVLDLLGICANEIVSWREIVLRIKERIEPDMLDGICGNCPWLPGGYCKKGISAIKEKLS